MSPIELAISEAVSRGLRIERLPIRSKKHTYDTRLILIEGKRCQVIPSKLGHPNDEYPDAECLSLYLPRDGWPDYLIYVLSGNETSFWIIPRAEMSKDTGRTPESLEPYRGAWDLLQRDLAQSPKEFEVLSWQLQAVKASTQKAGFEVKFIPTKKHQNGRRWPPIIKRRILVGGRKCSIFSATRISQDPQKLQYNYAVFRVPPDEWCDFQIYILKNLDTVPEVFVLPRNHILKTTSVCLDHPELAKYKNAWSVLTCTHESASENLAIQWREPAIPDPPSKRFMILQKVVSEAASQGLAVESTEGPGTSYTGGQSFLYICERSCQVMQATRSIETNGRLYLYLNPPTSKWAEFLIFYSVESDNSESEKFYVIPRTALPHQTARSPESKWLKEYEGAWDLLRRL
jgi:hypothetical protein